MPRKWMQARGRRRFPGPAVSGNLTAPSASPGALPKQVISLPRAVRVDACQVRSRRRGGFAPANVRLCDIALSHREPRTFADSHGSVEHPLPRLPCEHRGCDAPSPPSAGNAVARSKRSCHCVAASPAAMGYLPPKMGPTATTKRLFRRLVLGPVQQNSQVTKKSDWPPPHEHIDSSGPWSTLSSFSVCPGGNINRDAQPCSRRLAEAHRAAVQVVSRGRGRCGCRLQLRPVGNRHAAHRVRLWQSGAGGCLMGQPAGVAMVLLSGKPPGAANEGAGLRAIPRDVNIQRETTVVGKSPPRWALSPSNTTRGAAGSSSPRPPGTSDEMATFVSVVGKQLARHSA